MESATQDQRSLMRAWDAALPSLHETFMLVFVAFSSCQVYTFGMNPQSLEAIVEGGVLRPLTHLGLPEQQHVLVTVVALTETERQATASCYDLALELRVIGVAENLPTDLGTNPAHFRAFGRR